MGDGEGSGRNAVKLEIHTDRGKGSRGQASSEAGCSCQHCNTHFYPFQGSVRHCLLLFVIDWV